MLTELDRSVIIAIASGFICGLSQSVLNDFFRIKIDKKSISLKLMLGIGLLTGVWAGIIWGVTTFTLANWDNTMTTAKLNRFAIFVPLSFPLSVILTRVLPLHSIFLTIFRRKNKTNN